MSVSANKISDEFIGSCGEVNWVINGLVCEGLPTVDLTHDDLSGCHQRPEEHRRCRRRGQYDLGFDPLFELLVEALDAVRRAGAPPLARRQAGEQLVASLLQAVGDITMTHPPLGDELATPILDILGRLGVDRVVLVSGDLLVQALGGVRQ